MYFDEVKFTDIFVSCGYMIRYHRKLCHFSQAELASKVGVSKNSISLYENNVVQPPITVLVRLACIFNCTIDSLYEMYLQDASRRYFF